MRHSIRHSYSEVFILCYQTDCVVCSDLGFNLHINASLGSGGGSAGRRRVGDTLIINLNITLIEDDGTGDPEPLLSLGPIFYFPTILVSSDNFNCKSIFYIFSHKFLPVQAISFFFQRDRQWMTASRPRAS